METTKIHSFRKNRVSQVLLAKIQYDLSLHVKK